jgi:hypothetical protein
VTSFVGYFRREAGAPALRLLFADLRGTGAHGSELALQSVTGYGLSAWNARWQRWLLESKTAPIVQVHGEGFNRDTARRARLSDLLFDRGHSRSAAEEMAPALTPALKAPAIRWRAGRAWLSAGDAALARSSLGAATEIGSLHGPWFGVHGRLLRESGDTQGAEQAFRLAISVDPLAEDAACEGDARPRTPASISPGGPLPADPARRELCLSARQRPRD